MTVRDVYLDNAATTPVDPRVTAAMQACLALDGDWANPSSSHAPGRRARSRVEQARADVAALIGADPAEVIFTSGATESDNLALLGALRFLRDPQRHVVTARTEHPAVLDACRQLEREGCAVTYLKPRTDGIVDPAQVAEALRPETRLVSIMHVNNEIGTVNDVAAIGRLCRARGVLFHVDAAQGAGKLALDVHRDGIDLLALTAHKVHGPKGIGALCVRREPRLGLVPLQFGGGQERAVRSGTLPTHQLVGIGEAFRIARSEMAADAERIGALRHRLWAGLQHLDGLRLNGDPERRVAGILNVTIEGIEGETLLYALRDLAVSSGSACASLHGEPSYVLRTLGRSEREAQGSLRLSLGRFTTQDDVDYAIERVVEEVTRLRAGRRAPDRAIDLRDDDGRYSGEVSRRFREMPGTAPLPGSAATVRGEAGSRDQGAAVAFELAVRSGRVLAARFEAFGCPHLVAVASWVAEGVIGLDPDGLDAWDWREAADAVAVPPAKTGRMLTIQDALRAAARNWRSMIQSTV